jgi:23S rRNA pseudouridine1911/1915/1917 synthase
MKEKRSRRQSRRWEQASGVQPSGRSARGKGKGKHGPSPVVGDEELDLDELIDPADAADATGEETDDADAVRAVARELNDAGNAGAAGDGDVEILNATAGDAARTGETGEHVRLRIRRKLPGRRLDKYLHGRFARLSRTLIQKMIKRGEITVNDRPTKPSYEMETGDIIDLVVPAPEPYELKPENIPLDIVYEDDYALAINKQPGIICHPARSTQSGTIANGLAYYASSLSNVPGEPFRPGIVHRLDKNTTGIMIIAKTDEAHWKLAKQFEDRTTEKIYVAIVHGNLELDGDVIDVPLKNHATVHDRYVVSGLAERLGGRFKRQIEREAVTRYEVVDRYGYFTLVRLYPKTGRTHQLRVHMSHIGHPMAGDPFYGGSYVHRANLTGIETDSTEVIFSRQALHAWRLKVRHPFTGEDLQLEAPMPDDMTMLIEILEGHRRDPPRKRRR